MLTFLQASSICYNGMQVNVLTKVKDEMHNLKVVFTDKHDAKYVLNDSTNFETINLDQKFNFSQKAHSLANYNTTLAIKINVLIRVN